MQKGFSNTDKEIFGNPQVEISDLSIRIKKKIKRSALLFIVLIDSQFCLYRTSALVV